MHFLINAKHQLLLKAVRHSMPAAAKYVKQGIKRP
jgi:hypothetical protein